MTRSVVELESPINRLGTEKRLLMLTSKELISCTLQTTTKGGIITKKLLKNIRPVHLRLTFNDEKAILGYCNKNVREVIPFILELSRKWKRRSAAVEKTRIFQEDETMFSASILFLQWKMYVQHTQSVGNADQWLQVIVLFETCTQNGVLYFQ